MMTDAPERIWVKRANDGAWDEVSPDRYDDAMRYIRADVHAAEIERARREGRQRVLNEVSEQWSLAIYGATENGVRCLNEQAAAKLAKDYPDLHQFGEWLVNAELEEVTTDDD